MLRRILFACLLVLAAVSPALATSITATYTFTGSPGNQVSEPVDSNPFGGTFGDITRGPGLTPSLGFDSINSSNWTSASAIDVADFYEFVITPTPGFLLDVTTVSFTYRRSATGPSTFELRSSLNAFGPAGGAITTLGTANNRINLGVGPGFVDLAAPVTFRLYAYSSTSAAGTFRLGIDGSEAGSTLADNLQVVGDLSPAAVPEPATMLLLGSGLIVGATRRWRRNRQ